MQQRQGKQGRNMRQELPFNTGVEAQRTLKCLVAKHKQGQDRERHATVRLLRNFFLSLLGAAHSFCSLFFISNCIYCNKNLGWGGISKALDVQACELECNPRTCKMPNVAACAYHPSTEEMETAGSLGLSGQPA